MGGGEWTVQDVAGLLRSQKRAGRRCCLLIGAGVSRSAGIGTGPDFVQLIRKDYGDAYKRACGKTEGGADPDYGACMGELTEGERAQIVHEQVGKARINWAHIGIARLEMDGAEYVDRILTTNFDPLASRACALFNRFPAVYDLAALRNTDGSNRARFIPAFVRGSAIYHLHGQHTGFLLLNTRKLLEEQARRIEPALKEATAGRTVIVCGYSGENDPLVERISRQDVYPHGLIWVCHDGKDPCSQVMKVLRRIEDCYIVRNTSADRFFTDLANALDLPQPPFLIQPFHHMQTTLDHIRPYSDLSETGLDLLQHARALLETAEKRQAKTGAGQSDIAALMAQKKYDEILDRYEAVASDLDDGGKDLVAWAAIMMGLDLGDQAKRKEGDEADGLFGRAMEKYAAALAIKPDKYEALNNWGIALGDQAKLKGGDEVEALLGQAMEKYAAALAIKPDYHEALNNWGIALGDRAKLKGGAEAEALYGQAFEKYAAALAIKPDYHEALYNWGVDLGDQAKLKGGDEAEALLGQSMEKYAAALAINPDKHEALNNWGIALADQAKLKGGDEVEALLGEAMEKYAAALAIKPDKHEALNNWGIALGDQAKLKAGDEANALLGQAFEKYATALAIKPDYQEALNNWGIALGDQAKLKGGDEAEALFGQAFEKYAAALAIKPDYHEALYNWGTELLARAHSLRGRERDSALEEAERKFLAVRSLQPNLAPYNLACIAALRGEGTKAAQWLRAARAEGDLPDCAHIAMDPDLDAVREDPQFAQALRDVGC
ncbi:MAG TPA: SIR2 family protein [Allosphingosinicella sp.]|jgi:hypothetical protein